VEVAKRSKNEQEYLFILNHNNHPVEFSLPGAFQDLITRNRLKDKISINPKDVVILIKAYARKKGCHNLKLMTPL